MQKLSTSIMAAAIVLLLILSPVSHVIASEVQENGDSLMPAPISLAESDEPTDPAPTDPEPTDPAPTDPEPTDPEPTDPEPTDPEPTDPEPTDPDPPLNNGEIYVLALDTNGSGVSGVGFLLQTATGETYTLVTDSNGFAGWTGLALGQYTVYVTSLPETDYLSYQVDPSAHVIDLVPLQYASANFTLYPVVKRNLLVTAITQGNEIVPNMALYETTSFNRMHEALLTAVAVHNDELSTASLIQAATENLRATIADLKPAPTEAPTERPTTKPTERPTTKTTERPTTKPTERPTTKTTERPTTKPTERPTTKPTERPTTKPTERPTTKPTERPTTKPTASLVTRPPSAKVTQKHDPTPRPTRSPMMDISQLKKAEPSSSTPTSEPLLDEPAKAPETADPLVSQMALPAGLALLGTTLVRKKRHD